jgi:hypothetical protein
VVREVIRQARQCRPEVELLLLRRDGRVEEPLDLFAQMAVLVEQSFSERL